MRRAAAFAVVAAACGRLDFTPLARSDGGGGGGGGSSDASDASDAGGTAACTWSTPVRVADLATADEDWEPALSPDGSLMVFQSDRVDDATPQLYSSTPAGSGWSPPLRVTSLSSAQGDEGPEWNAGGTRLYFASLRADGVTARLYTSAYAAGAFAAPQLISELTTAAVGPCVAFDEFELIYTTSDGSAGAPSELARATRASTSDPWTEAGLVTELNSLGNAGWCTLSPDALTIVFEGSPLGSPTDDLYTATRVARDQPFAAPARLDVSDPTFDDGDPDLAAGGKTLYFASNRGHGSAENDNSDIFMSECQ